VNKNLPLIRRRRGGVGHFRGDTTPHFCWGCWRLRSSSGARKRGNDCRCGKSASGRPIAASGAKTIRGNMKPTRDGGLLTHTKYGGARQRDYLEAAPANVILFAGYGFGKEYLSPRTRPCHRGRDPDEARQREDAGHLLDVQEPGRAAADTHPWPREVYAGKFDALKSEIKHPIGCLDCHEPNTMRLRITRPALGEAFQRQGKDIDKVSHQEMRTLVCASATWNTIFTGRETT